MGKRKRESPYLYPNLSRWAYTQIARELGIPESIVRLAPRAVDLINEYRGFYSPASEVGRPRAVAAAVPDNIPTPTQTQTYTYKRPKTQTQRAPNNPGMYTGRFRKPKRQPNIYNGVVYKREDGFNVSDDDGTATPGAYASPIGSAWTGITALPWFEFPRNVLLSILRKLCAAKGFEFNSADDLVADTMNTTIGTNVGTFHYTYRKSGNNIPVEQSFAIVAGHTWGDLAATWVTNIGTFITSYGDIHFDKIWIYGKDNDGPNITNLMPVMSLNLTGMKIKYSASHSIFIQNRTKDTGAGESTDAIDTNPLYGKIYIIGNSFLRTNLQSDDPGVAWGVANDQSGRFVIEPQKWTANGNMQQLFSRPVPKAAFNRCYQVSNIRLQPGEIKKATVTMRDTLSFDDLFMKVFLPGYATPEDMPIKYGKSMVVAFQKVVRTAAVNSSEAYDCRIQLACTTRQYQSIEAIPKRKQAFIAQNIQPEVS